VPAPPPRIRVRGLDELLRLGIDVVSQPHESRVAVEIEALNASGQAGIGSVGPKKQFFGQNYQASGLSTHLGPDFSKGVDASGSWI